MSVLTPARSIPQTATRTSLATYATITYPDAVIPVGSNPLGVALNPGGSGAYVANAASNTVSVIDTATNTVTATIPTGAGPTLLAISPDGARVYVTLSGAAQLGVIDTVTNTVTANIAVGGSPIGVAVTPNGARVYVANQSDNTVSVIDTATSTVTATVPVGNRPLGVSVTPDGTRAYVGNTQSNTVSVIDTATNTVTATIAVGSGPEIVAFTPDGSLAYASNGNGNTVSVIDTATNTVTATIAVGTQPRDVASSPDGSHVYVANYGSNTVGVINTATNTVAGNLRVGEGPTGIAVPPDDSRLYVTNTDAGTVSVIPLNLIPNEGSTAGGITVTVNGHNLAGASAVNFGTASATILSNTATSITAVLPGGAGTVPVTVTTPGGTGLLGYFFYFPAPQVNDISPTQGPAEGGNTAVITGFNLAGAISVAFGPTRATIQSATDTQLTVTVGGTQNPGTVPVTVTTPGGTADDLSYTYLPMPAITNVTPNTASTSGGTSVTLTGSGFATTQLVTFENVPADFTVLSDNEITAIAPPQSPGQNITISVTTAGGSGSWNLFTYQSGPAI
ncbi:IPT/TIG domain-containing protein [Streptomyces sp. NPDC047515]|uniref:IPT/TIG domain-containing protein n=1 Tax=Streptomyces sp. NPDC047515 TaxID=3155380 RepID=UPI00340133BB